MKQPERRKKLGKIILFSTIGLVSYSGFLITNMPAGKLWQYLPTDHFPVQPTGISGTLWSGSAESMAISLSREPLILPSIRWQIKPVSLLEGKLKVDMSMGSAASVIEGEGIITISQQAVKLEDVELDTSAQWLVSATGDQVPGDLTGNVMLQLDELVVDDKGCIQINGDAEMTNSQLVSAFGRFDLGNSTAELSCQNQQLVARVNQKSSIISSYGEFQIGTSGRYTFTGKMTPDSSLPEPISKGLSMLGRPDSKGAYPLQFRGSIN